MDTTPASGTTSDLTGPASGPVDGAPTSIPRLLLERLRESLSDPTQVLAIVLIAAFATRVIWLDMPRGSLIFDEAYYVNAARTILGWVVPAGGHYADAVAGLDPNSEHPPLGKLLMALSMLVFGDNGIGWRLPSLIAGMTALGTLYLIVRAAGESAWLGVLAVGFFAFDNLSLVHGRIGTLDMMVLAFVLLGAWSALRSRWLLAGVFVGLGMLVKLTALYGLLALLILLALALWQTWVRPWPCSGPSRWSPSPDCGSSTCVSRPTRTRWTTSATWSSTARTSSRPPASRAPAPASTARHGSGS
jgi:hypothetical protein